MSVTLRRSGEDVGIHWAWETPTPGARVDLRHAGAALMLLTRVGAQDPGLAGLRRLAGDHLGVGSRLLDDADLFARLAEWLRTGTLRVTRKAHAPLSAQDGDVEEAPIVAEARQARPAEAPVVEIEPPTFPEDIDAAAIATAKKKAARLGVPFCEQCMKKKKDADERRGAAVAPS